MDKKTGVVYKLTNGQLNYIGSTFDLKQRKHMHKQIDYLQKILKSEKCRYDIMAEGEFTKRELLDEENKHILNNNCINKKKPLTQFKSKQHKAMLKWGKKYVHCDCCNVDITRWNWCKHVKTTLHKVNVDKPENANQQQGGKMTYMKALKIYNEQEKLLNPDHQHIVPRKGTKEHTEIMDIFAKHI